MEINFLVHLTFHTFHLLLQRINQGEVENYFQQKRCLCAEYCKDIQHPPDHSIRIRRGAAD